jgi:hypothetical protein
MTVFNAPLRRAKTGLRLSMSQAMLKKTISCLIAMAGVIALSTNAHAEVKKFMNIAGGKMQPFFRLEATPPRGWIVEQEATKKYGVQMLVPKGKTFGNADAVIYVKVSYKHKDLDQAQFIKTSQDDWREAVPDTTITKLPEVTRANGRAAFLPYQYENPSQPKQPFEYVAFGEDGDKDGNTFNLIVTVTGGDRKVIEKAAASYNAFLRAH